MAALLRFVCPLFMKNRVSLLSWCPVFLGIALAFPSSELKAQAAPATKKADRTSNRGPEQIDLKFKLPVPPVLTPAEAAKAIKLPKGFKIQCIASEPMIEAPVSMSWDDQGRLYVCEMRGYMNDANAKGEDQPLGRISRLEDTDGDGIMDKSTVFVDKLLMPRSVTAFGDGVIVAEPPNLVWYHDTKGTGVSDKSETIATDFATQGGQPEHMANSLTFTQDNWLWAANYSQKLKYVKGKFVSEGTRSGGQWGLTQDDWGRRYYNYNSDFLRMDLLPPSVYARNPNLADKTALNWQVMKDQHCFSPVPTPGVNRGYQEGVKRADGTQGEGQLRADGTLASCTGTCGPVIYRGGLFGKEFQGNAFIPEPCGNLVKRLILSENGGVVSAKNAYPATEFLYSTDERFRPVNAYNGPDGALYIVDMARGIVQHKFFLTHYLIANIEARKLETPVNLGRIWKIVPDHGKDKESAPLQAVKMPQETAMIIALLDHPNGHVRDTAQRMLVERADAGAVEPLKNLTKEAKTPQGKVHALWALEAYGPVPPDVITSCLKDADAKVRAAAVRLATLGNITDLMAMQEEQDAEVRVQLALQLSSQNNPEAQAIVLKLLKAGGSPLLNDAIASGGRGHELEYLEELLKVPAGKVDTLAKSGLLKMLAGCVMNERRSARIARLLELTAAQAPDSPRQLALVQGIAGIPSDSKSKVQPRKLLYFDAEPAALTTLAAKTNKQLQKKVKLASGEDKTLVELVAGAIAWPGKAGVPPPPVVVPLNAEQQARYNQGKVIYSGLCAACHQTNGLGLEGLAPPLVDSEWVLGNPDRAMRIIMHGLTGPVNVGGRTWRMEMPPLTFLTDDDIAAILTYTRREWEHNASPVAPNDVKKARETYKGRTKAWTADELMPPKKKK